MAPARGGLSLVGFAQAPTGFTNLMALDPAGFKTPQPGPGPPPEPRAPCGEVLSLPRCPSQRLAPWPPGSPLAQAPCREGSPRSPSPAWPPPPPPDGRLWPRLEALRARRCRPASPCLPGLAPSARSWPAPLLHVCFGLGPQEEAREDEEGKGLGAAMAPAGEDALRPSARAPSVRPHRPGCSARPSSQVGLGLWGAVPSERASVCRHGGGGGRGAGQRAGAWARALSPRPPSYWAPGPLLPLWSSLPPPLCPPSAPCFCFLLRHPSSLCVSWSS